VATRVSILGSTGSIGRSALQVVQHHRDAFEVVGLGAHSSVDVLCEQIETFNPKFLAMEDEAAAAELEARNPGPTILKGKAGAAELAAQDVDVVLCGIVGAAGLHSVVAALEAGNRVALANKEPLVMAGRYIMETARRNGVPILPVDSEHNAIFQCLEGHSIEDVHRVHLTASGGPFYGRSRESLAQVSPEEAANHPTWDMGAKISVDSATLMNKGLEVIEAMWLFGLPLDAIEVVIHPQSIVHSLVEFTDGSILAHLGVTDMQLPIQFALMWPKRVKSPVQRLELTHMKDITFAAPDFSAFPCLSYALDAARQGGTAPAVLNAANEEAVRAFCGGRISFLQIADIVSEVLENTEFSNNWDLDSVLLADAEARARANGYIDVTGAK